MDEQEPPEVRARGPLGPQQLAYFKRPQDWWELLESVGADRSQAEALTRVYRARAEAENARRQLLVRDERLQGVIDMVLLDPSVFDRGLAAYLQRLEEQRGEAS
jgi:hypothetical protein